MGYRYRSAVTGEYVTREYADANPDTTVAETVNPVLAVYRRTADILRRRAQRKLTGSKDGR